jgi:uncharacterized protein DUF6894
MRYFFHIQSGRRISDLEGNEYPDDKAAMAEAALVAKQLGKSRSDAAAWRLVLTNQDGQQVMEVGLAAGSPLVKAT